MSYESVLRQSLALADPWDDGDYANLRAFAADDFPYLDTDAKSEMFQQIVERLVFERSTRKAHVVLTVEGLHTVGEDLRSVHTVSQTDACEVGDVAVVAWRDVTTDSDVSVRIKVEDVK